MRLLASLGVRVNVCAYMNESVSGRWRELIGKGAHPLPAAAASSYSKIRLRGSAPSYAMPTPISSDPSLALGATTGG